MIRRGLSLVEAIIVIVIIGLLAVLAVPRFSRAGPEPDSFNPRPVLVTLRSAIELYYYDHGAYPGQQSDGLNPPGSAAALTAQLTGFTDAAGRVAAEKSETFHFGPYLRDGVPPCPVPPRRGICAVFVTTRDPAFEAASEAGWIYNCQTGAVALNSNVLDPDGLPYARY
jgi:prepilin-type N-terminal cleavage/methylation domain-containing protein